MTVSGAFATIHMSELRLLRHLPIKYVHLFNVVFFNRYRLADFEALFPVRY